MVIVKLSHFLLVDNASLSLTQENLWKIFCPKFHEWYKFYSGDFVSLLFSSVLFHLGELDRQNKITQEILAKYLQRRLFPHLVYPRGLDGSALAKSLQKAGIVPRSDSDQHDTLETVESERISNFQLFGDDLQGKFSILLTFAEREKSTGYISAANWMHLLFMPKISARELVSEQKMSLPASCNNRDLLPGSSATPRTLPRIVILTIFASCIIYGIYNYVARYIRVKGILLHWNARRKPLRGSHSQRWPAASWTLVRTILLFQNCLELTDSQNPWIVWTPFKLTVQLRRQECSIGGLVLKFGRNLFFERDSPRIEQPSPELTSHRGVSFLRMTEVCSKMKINLSHLLQGHSGYTDQNGHFTDVYHVEFVFIRV